MNERLKNGILNKASIRLIKKDKELTCLGLNCQREADDMKYRIDNIRFTIEILKEDIDYSKKTKHYIVEKILTLKNRENNLIDERNAMRLKAKEFFDMSNEYGDVVSDEYYDLF